MSFWEEELEKLKARRPDLKGEVEEAMRLGAEALKAAEERRYRQLLDSQLSVLSILSRIGMGEVGDLYERFLNELVNRVRASRGGRD